jgi:hypothetical protein
LAHTISDVNLDAVDYHCAEERHRRNLPTAEEPKAKQIKNEVLGKAKYTELAIAYNECYKTSLSSNNIAFMDLTLQKHRAAAKALYLLNNPPKHVTNLTNTAPGPPTRTTTQQESTERAAHRLLLQCSDRNPTNRPVSPQLRQL